MKRSLDGRVRFKNLSSVSNNTEPPVPKKLKLYSAEKSLSFGIPQFYDSDSSSKVWSLPVAAERCNILRAIQESHVVILSGEAGSGKSTQVPKLLLLEAIRNKPDRVPRIAVTQPRRVAATSLATRVAQELKDDHECFLRNKCSPNALGASDEFQSKWLDVGGIVGFRVRFKESTSKATKIEYLTDGMLLRHGANQKRPFSKYDYIIVDEAHERSLRSDFILGCVFKIISDPTVKRKPKVIVMSATLESAKFVEFFKVCKEISVAVVNVPGRAFPVSVQNSLVPQSDCVKAVASTVVGLLLDGRRQEGDILCFLPGVEEINAVRSVLEISSKKMLEFSVKLTTINIIKNSLSHHFRSISREKVTETLSRWQSNLLDFQSGISELCGNVLTTFTPDEIKMLQLALVNVKPQSFDDVTVAVQCPSNCSFSCADDVEGGAGLKLVLNTENVSSDQLRRPIAIIPLYASLTIEEQSRIFQLQNGHTRRIILSTNIAETSVTVPGIKYVVDSGLVKLNFGSSLKLVNISRAMAAQRAGRSGRISEGEVFRVYTDEAFDGFESQILPEILRVDLSETLLELHCLGIPDMTKLHLLDMPEIFKVQQASEVLTKLGALKRSDNEYSMTPKGRMLAALPVGPVHGNLLLAGHEGGCLAEILTIVAMLSCDVQWFSGDQIRPQSSGDVFSPSKTAVNKVALARQRYFDSKSDHVTLLKMFNAWQRHEVRKDFCHATKWSSGNFQKAANIRNQLKNIILNRSDLFNVKAISSVSQFSDALPEQDSANPMNLVRMSLFKGYVTQTAKLVINTGSTGGNGNLAPSIASSLGEKFGISENEKFKVAAGLGLVPKEVVKAGVVSSGNVSEYLTDYSKESIQVHPSSVLFRQKRAECVVYDSIMETTKKFGRYITEIDPQWVVASQ